MMKHKLKLRLPFIVTILLVGSLWALGYSYMYWEEGRDVKAKAAAETTRQIEFDRQITEIKQRKIEEARRLEEESRRKAEEEAKKAAEKATAAPVSATVNPTCDVTSPEKITVVVNKKHCFKPLDWAPSDLVLVEGFYLRSEAASNFNAMRAAAAASGIQMDITSAYRSYSTQVATYNYWVSTSGSIAAADTGSARPGYSEHQTGLAVDLRTTKGALDNFSGTAAYNWLKANAANYGFIERYQPGMTSITGYRAESWHWRYVGKDLALDMKAKGLTTLEAYFGITGGDY